MDFGPEGYLYGPLFFGGAIAEQHDEWQVTDRRYLSEESMALIWAIHQDDHNKEVNQLPAAE